MNKSVTQPAWPPHEHWYNWLGQCVSCGNFRPPTQWELEQQWRTDSQSGAEHG